MKFEIPVWPAHAQKLEPEQQGQCERAIHKRGIRCGALQARGPYEDLLN
jgi:hypothetical protein